MKTKITKIEIYFQKGERKQELIYSCIVEKKTKEPERFIRELLKKYENCDVDIRAINSTPRALFFQSVANMQKGERMRLDENKQRLGTIVCNVLSKKYNRLYAVNNMYLERIS